MKIDDFFKRCNNDFYVGVVGSVRSGKSSFINRFVELKILPYIKDYDSSKIIDDLPQSAQGKMIMTTEPKFVPNVAINININDINLNVRLVDSVGFVIPNALGYFTEDGPRMVKTPWFDEEIPFKEAAYLGTKKVITNHSTIGIMVTSDGTIGEFKRSDYETVEESLINELKELNKPFVIVLNSKTPNSAEALRIKDEIMNKYDVSVMNLNVLEMTNEQLDELLISSLNEFEIKELNINIPKWIDSLDENFEYKKLFNDAIVDTTNKFKKFKDIKKIKEELSNYSFFKSVEITTLDPSNSSASIDIIETDEIYDEVVNELLDGIDTKEDYIMHLIESSKMLKDFKKYKNAILELDRSGYSVVVPSVEDLSLETPEIIKSAGRYGIKLKAVGDSIHLIKVSVDSTFEPIIGSIEQAQNMADSIKSDEEAWNLDMFGRSLKDLVIDGIKTKINLIPLKLKETLKSSLEKIINEQTGGMIAVIL